jgi:Rod binding domain-containing protein
MSSVSDIAGQSLFDSQADQMAASATRAKPADAKLKTYAHKFEAILIAKWLEEAEASFAKLPGDDQDPDADPGQDQFRSMAQQFLAESISSAGGLGIASMIVKHLEQQAHAIQQIDTKEVNGGGSVSTVGANTTDY